MRNYWVDKNEIYNKRALRAFDAEIVLKKKKIFKPKMYANVINTNAGTKPVEGIYYCRYYLYVNIIIPAWPT